MALRSYQYSDNSSDGINLIYPKTSQVNSRVTVPKQIFDDELVQQSYQHSAFAESIQAPALNFGPLFWFILSALLLLPLLYSSCLNTYNLVNNIKSSIVFNNQLNKLMLTQEDLSAKIKSCASYSGMKRTIQEEIKVIEANEILVKIIK